MCEFCEGSNSSELLHSDVTDDYVIIQNDRLVIRDNDDEYSSTKIKMCPKCGRVLSEPWYELYTVTYTMRQNVSAEDWGKFLKTIKSIGFWNHPMECVWYVCTIMSISNVSKILEDIAKTCFTVYAISKVDRDSICGVLPKPTWEWMIKLKVGTDGITK